MSFAAFQMDFERLSDVTRVQTREVVEAGEVVSIAMGTLIRRTNKLVDLIGTLRALFITGVSLIEKAEVENEHFDEEHIDRVAHTRVLVERFERRVRQPMMANIDGVSLISAAEALTTMKTESAGDGRTLRRLAKRIEQAAEACEVRRIHFHASITGFRSLMDEIVEQSAYRDKIQAAQEDHLTSMVISRHPIIIDHLAK